DDALDACRIQVVGLADDHLERALCQLLQRVAGFLVTQQALWRHDHQRLTQRRQHLTTQHVKYLRRSGRQADLDIVLGAQLQEALQTCRRVFRSLPFVAVWQQQGQAAQALPLVLTAGDELVDNHLGAVGEVAELGFPDYQGIRRGRGIAILEGQYRHFRKQRVIDAEAAGLWHQLCQRNVLGAGLLVVQHRVSVGERATSHILPGDAHLVAGRQDAGVGQGFSKTPIDGLLARRHGLTVVDDFLYLTLQVKFRGHGDYLACQRLQRGELDLGVIGGSPLVAKIRTPVHKQLYRRLLDQ